MTVAYRFGRFELKPAARELLVEGVAAPLGMRAFDVLLALIERRERLVSKEELLDLAWPGLVVQENNLQVQISSLRKILGDDQRPKVLCRPVELNIRRANDRNTRPPSVAIESLHPRAAAGTVGP